MRRLKTYTIDGESVYLSLTQGKVATIDVEDLDRVKPYLWCATESRGIWYAVSRVGGENVLLHRFLLGCKKRNQEIDHKDGDGLNNRRANLRQATHAQNISNQSKHTDNTSGYKGVSWNHRGRAWCARIRAGGRGVWLGNYPTPKEASAAYNAAAVRLHKQFARLNP